MIEDMPAVPPDAIAHRFEASGIFVGEHAQKIIALIDRGLLAIQLRLDETDGANIRTSRYEAAPAFVVVVENSSKRSSAKRQAVSPPIFSSRLLPYIF